MDTTQKTPVRQPRKEGTASPKKPSQRPAAQKAPQKKAPVRRTSQRREDTDTLASRKRAYGNSKPKKKTTLDRMGDMMQEASRKRTKKRAAKQKDPRTRSQQPAPAVIYTQPQAFNRSRFLVQMLTVTAIVAALVLGLSVFFKVENITVSGTDVYTPWTVKEVAGIEAGDNLLTFSRTRAAAQIKANLPYVRDVSFGIKLPDTVNIIIVEERVVYAIKDENGQWWLMNSEGRIIEQTNAGKATNYTQVLGVTIVSPEPGEDAVAAEMPQQTELSTQPTEETQATVAPIPVGATGGQRLAVAMEILQLLEDNDIVGTAASVNVHSIQDITLWYGTRYQVSLGDSSRLDYKISCMSNVILRLSDYQSGILDLSFTVWPDKVGYTPFS